MRYTVTTSRVQVVGTIWMPAVVCAMDYTWSTYDVENARDDEGNLTRESVERWLILNSGDFQSIIDFRADLVDGKNDFVSDWSDEESEFTYNDCMYGDES